MDSYTSPTMPILKQKTVSVGNQSQTVVLKKLKKKMGRGGEWMYVIEDKDTGGRIEDPFTNKRKARREFNQTIRDIERGMEAAKKDRGGGGPQFEANYGPDFTSSIGTFDPEPDDDSDPFSFF